MLGGASTSFGMLVTARALQGVFGALLAPAALSLLNTTFTDAKERAKAFSVYGAIAGAGGAVGLLLGGVLTDALDWRWTLFVNLVFAVVAFAGGWVLLSNHRDAANSKLDLPGTLLVSSGLFALVYGFSNAETHDWSSPLTWGFLIAGGVLLSASPGGRRAPGTRCSRCACCSTATVRVLRHRSDHRCGHVRRLPLPHLLPAAEPGLQPHQDGCGVPADDGGPDGHGPGLHHRPGAADRTEGRHPGGLRDRGGRHGLADRHRSRLRLLDRRAAAAASDRRGPRHRDAAPAMSLATSGIAAEDAGVASATVNTMQQVGGSIGTALLNTLAASAATSYLAGKDATSKLVQAQATIESYTTAFWWSAGFFAAGAVIAFLLYRRGTLDADPDAVRAVRM